METHVGNHWNSPGFDGNRTVGASTSCQQLRDWQFATHRLPRRTVALSPDYRHDTESIGLSIKKTLKVKPLKKIPQTNAIFGNVHECNAASDENPQSLRILIDTKAKVTIGELSRGGKDRTRAPRKAHDHDTEIKAVLVPVGILDVKGSNLSICFGQSVETSDLIADCLEQWWESRRHVYPQITELVINLDNGPSVQSHRTQFLKRLVELSENSGLIIRLMYYPPYHSKYNPIEHCWGALETYWNGAILDSIEAAMQWTSNMTWNGIHPNA